MALDSQHGREEEEDVVPSCLGEELQGAGVRDRGVAWRRKDLPWATLTLWPKTPTEPCFCFWPYEVVFSLPTCPVLLLCGRGAPATSGPASLCEVILVVCSCRVFFFFCF